MKQINKLLFITIVYLTQACANDGPEIQLIGEFSKEEIKSLQMSADEWCNNGMDCVSFTSESRPDKIEIKKHNVCRDFIDDIIGCAATYHDPLDEHSEIYIQDNRSFVNWERFLQHVVLHELGHYLTRNSLNHIVTNDINVVMRGDNRITPIALTIDDIEWAQSAWVTTSNDTSY